MVKRALLASLALLLLGGGGAIASRNDGGSMLVHTDDAVSFSSGWDYCANNPLPATCGELITQTNAEPENVNAIIWVVGAFDPSSSPGVTAYQFGIYHNLPTGYFTAWGACGPGALEIPDATWPDESGTGTAIAYGAAVYPHFLFKMYWFAVAGQVGTHIDTGAFPHGTNGAAFADDGSPPLVDTVTRFGSVHWGEQGSNTCPVPPATGACCNPDATCVVGMENDCQAAHGIYLGNNSECTVENRCSACCYLDDQSQHRLCVVTTETLCNQRLEPAWSGWAGIWPEGNGNACAATAQDADHAWWCSEQTPTKATTWGRLRTLFR